MRNYIVESLYEKTEDFVNFPEEYDPWDEYFDNEDECRGNLDGKLPQDVTRYIKRHGSMYDLGVMPSGVVFFDPEDEDMQFFNSVDELISTLRNVKADRLAYYKSERAKRKNESYRRKRINEWLDDVPFEIVDCGNGVFKLAQNGIINDRFTVNGSSKEEAKEILLNNGWKESDFITESYRRKRTKF